MQQDNCNIMELPNFSSISTSTLEFNVASDLDLFDDSFSSDCVNGEDPFAPIKDLDDLFDNDKPQCSITIQPRPLQEMIGSSIGFESLAKNFLMVSSEGSNDGTENVLSALLDPQETSFQSSNNNCTKTIGLPASAMSLITSAEALLSDDIFADIPRTQFCIAEAIPRRERLESIDCDDLLFEALIPETTKNTSQTKKRPNKEGASRPTKRTKVESKSDEINDAMSSSSSVSASSDDDVKFRNYQTEKWMQKFDELIEFKKENGHCQVPHSYAKNLSLGRWAKRQRYQYKLYKEGKASTMCEDRIAALEKLGFVWDSHSALWEERYRELLEFYIAFGHSNVPSSFPPNPKLAIWVKCQRRQRKLLCAGEPSNMTLPRVERLNRLNFVWEVRKVGI